MIAPKIAKRCQQKQVGYSKETIFALDGSMSHHTDPDCFFKGNS